MHNLPIAKNEAALIHLAAVAAEAQEMRLLKFVKGKWYVGDDELSLGREFIAHVPQLAHGMVKFVDGKVAEQRVGIVADGFVLPSRDELGDIDSKNWETDHAGAPRDPWCHQYYLPLEDNDTGELFTFVTGSQGGNSAIGKLTSQFVRNARNGLPRVRLATGSYKHKTFGRVEVPEFSVRGWTGASDNFAPRGDGGSDEEIPF
jgi:hypothetical protein